MIGASADSTNSMRLARHDDTTRAHNIRLWPQPGTPGLDVAVIRRNANANFTGRCSTPRRALRCIRSRRHEL